MKKTLLMLLLSGAAGAQAQTAPSETEAVKRTIRTLFEGMRRGDSTMVRSVLAPGAAFNTVVTRNGTTQVASRSPAEFLKSVGTPHPEVWEERTSAEQIRIDASLANVWAPYTFYLGGKLHHCGYDSFQLVKLGATWKITYLIWTTRSEACK